MADISTTPHKCNSSLLTCRHMISNGIFWSASSANFFSRTSLVLLREYARITCNQTKTEQASPEHFLKSILSQEPRVLMGMGCIKNCVVEGLPIYLVLCLWNDLFRPWSVCHFDTTSNGATKQAQFNKPIVTDHFLSDCHMPHAKIAMQ